MVLLLCAPLAASGETRFRDDFNRPDGETLGNGWNPMPQQNACAIPSPGETKKKKYADISEEIEKKTAAKESPDKAESAPKPPRKDGVTHARIQDGQLLFQYEQPQDVQMVQQDFAKKVLRLSYDFTPLYAMGGLDDRAWIGVRIYYLDAEGLILGEIRHFYYQALFMDREETPLIHTESQQGGFDSSPRHVTVDAGRILEQRLTGVDRKRIAKTRISFEISSGLCESSLEGAVDNVEIVMEDIVEPFRFTRETLQELTELSQKAYSAEERKFPDNAKRVVFEKLGRQNILGWLNNDIPRDAREDLGRLTGFLAERYRVTGRDAWLSGYAVYMLLQSSGTEK
ncbi:MAG: hypothetical protein HQM03_13860 [Magnetococcales bacterium]|nr:hypothetical protein [Magnetococcales bacterium]